MLELEREHIHMNRFKSNVETQITLDDDFIVPDTMDDIARVVMDSGDIQIEMVKNQGEKVLVKGKLNFQILYCRAEGGLQTLAGHIPLEESVNAPGLEEKDDLEISWDLEDLSTSVINSRKLNVKAIVTLKLRIETLEDAQAAVDVTEHGETVQGLEILRRQAEAAAIAVRRKDTFRLKEAVSLTGTKPSIEEIQWSEIYLRGVSTKPLDGQIHIEGEVMIFIIYRGEGENTPVQWLEESIPFSGEVELPEAAEDMVPFITVRLVHKELEAKPDYDGEMRDLELDAVLELDMKLYEEQQIELLGDVYANDREVTPEQGQVFFDHFLCRNTGKCKIAEKVDLGHSSRILQICHNDGTVKIDEVSVQENTLQIEGVLEVTLLYLTDDDNEPVKAEKTLLPFQYEAEADGITDDSVYQLNSNLEQMTAVMAGGDTVEVKAVLSFDFLVLQPVSQQMVTGITESPQDMERLQNLPGIVGYIVQPGDTLWDIAKRFHTTRNQVMESNGLTEAEPKPGSRLILVKEIAWGSPLQTISVAQNPNSGI